MPEARQFLRGRSSGGRQYSARVADSGSAQRVQRERRQVRRTSSDGTSYVAPFHFENECLAGRSFVDHPQGRIPFTNPNYLQHSCGLIRQSPDGMNAGYVGQTDRAQHRTQVRFMEMAGAITHIARSSIGEAADERQPCAIRRFRRRPWQWRDEQYVTV
jgi:hypothetical protein